MPFCTKCGNEVGPQDRYCLRCGSVQSAGSGSSATPPPPTGGGGPNSNMFTGFSARSIALLCYVPVVGCIMSLVVLAAGQFQKDRETRFHAFQGLYLSVGWLLAHLVIRPMIFAFAFKALAVGAMIFMIIKLAQNQTFKLPLLGDLAEKSVSEQR